VTSNRVTPEEKFGGQGIQEKRGGPRNVQSGCVGKIPFEQGKSLKSPKLCLRKQLDDGIKHCREAPALVGRLTGSQERDAFLNTLSDLRGAKGGRPGRGKLNAKRAAIHQLADPADRPNICLRATAKACTLQEKLN